MNQKPAHSPENKFFRQELISFSEIPKQSKLFTDFLKNTPEAIKFYSEKNTSLEKYAEQVLAKYSVDRDALCEILTETNQAFGAGKKTFENIKRLREKDCLTIVTGQQAGLFSGALYTIYKALSAVKLAENLQNQNIKAVPVFWIAEEDHDFDEIKKTIVLDKEGKLAELENTPENYQKDVPVGLIELDESIEITIQNLFEKLSPAEFTEELHSLLSKCYASTETYSSAFAKFIAQIFADYGLIIFAPLNKKLKKLCAPIFTEGIEKSAEINAALLNRNIELQSENYQAQVLVEKDFFPFFLQSETGERQSLKLNAETGKIKIQKSKDELSLAELNEIAVNDPEKLSPNALMRPIVQDYLLPTLVYFGGGAEIAYFAQNSVIYNILNRPVTPIRHRASFTIIERKHARTLEKYELKFKDVFQGKADFSALIVEKFLNRNAARTFKEVENSIKNQLDLLAYELNKSELTLAANLETRRKKIMWHISALRKKFHRAEVIKNNIVERRVESLFTALFPENALQERSLNVITFLNLYGENFNNWIYDAVDPNELKHQILYL